MNLAACGALPRRPETQVWFRALEPQFWTTSLATAQTAVIPSRFNAGANATPPFEILYLAENPLVALFEVQALFGTPTQPGGVFPHPRQAWITVNVTVQLQAVTDLPRWRPTRLPGRIGENIAHVPYFLLWHIQDYVT